MVTTFKDLCLDTQDPEAAAQFWGPTLGLQPQGGPVDSLADEVPGHRLWLNQVPEAKGPKLRVHLDVHVASVEEVLARGAAVVDDAWPWTVMADPEGHEFCAFVRSPDKLPDYRFYELVIDAVDAPAIARWWGEVFGVPVEVDAEDGSAWLERVPGMDGSIVFAPVPEPKTVKNRVHWDVWGRTDELRAAGAELLRARDDEIGWDVLADPEGNEFCVFVRD